MGNASDHHHRQPEIAHGSQEVFRASRGLVGRRCAWPRPFSTCRPSSPPRRSREGQPLLAVAKGKDYGALVERVMRPLGGIAAFVQKGARVVVKPNIGWDRTPEQAANTHPDVVKAIVRQCLDAGRQAGAGLRSHLPGRPPLLCQERHPGGGRVDRRPARPVRVSRTRRSSCRSKSRTPSRSRSSTSTRMRWRPTATATSTFRSPSTTGLAKLTLGLKNVMGVIGGNRGEIHKDIGQRHRRPEPGRPPEADDHRRHAHPACATAPTAETWTT